MDCGEGVVDHDSEATRQFLKAFDRPRFEDVEEAEEDVAADGGCQREWREDVENWKGSVFVVDHPGRVFPLEVLGSGRTHGDADQEQDNRYWNVHPAANAANC